jgi:hypothetical protein
VVRASALALLFLVPNVRATTPVRVTVNAQASTSPAIATDIAGQSHIVWTDTRDGNAEIYYALVDGFGNRLTADIRVTTTPTVSSTLPRVGVDGQSNTYICWRESNNIWVAKLDRLGNSLVTPKAVNLGFSYVVMMGPDISVQTDGRFAVGLGAQHGGLDDMFVVNFDAGLNKLCQTSNLYTNLTFQDSKVSVKCSGNLNATLAWQQIGFLDGDNLATVGSAVNCSRGGVSYLCGGTNFTNPDIHGAGLLYVRSNHVSITPMSGCGSQLSENPGPSIAPSGDTLASDRSIAVWEDRRNGNADLYFAVYRNTGLVKLGVDSSLVTGTSASQVPSVSSDRNGTAFVTWQDDRDGNSEIYFTRTPDLSAYRGVISGTVIDGITLAPIPNAIVTLVGPARPSTAQDFVAGADGRYRLAGLAPGAYAVSASSAAHVSPTLTGIALTAGATVTRDLVVSTGTTLDGSVRDSLNHMGIGGARLHLASADASYIRDVQTTPEGRYHLDLPAGTFTLTASVPALGVAGPYFSPTNDLYHAKTLSGLLVGTSPEIRNLELASNTVLLVHGIKNDETAWGRVDAVPPGQPVTRRQLELAGLHTDAIRRDWTRSIPDQGLELQRWFAYQPYRSACVVAYSMGGLATRWYLERVALDGGANRVPLLVTLGTPNHGAPAASDVSDVLDLLGITQSARDAIVGGLDMIRIEFETKLLQRWTFLTDLRPNSANLNQLNYGDPAVTDYEGRFSCLDHAPEQIPFARRYVTIDGDSQQWLKILWAEIPCSSDGVVPVTSARLFKVSSSEQSIQNVRTSCLPDLDNTHDCGCAHVPFLGSTDYMRSSCVARNLVDLLNSGLPIAAQCPVVPAVVAAVDSSLQPLAERNHFMIPGSTAVDSFWVDEGDYFGMRVRWLRGGLSIALQDPDGMVIDSTSTVGNPTRLFASDWVNLFARLDVAGARSGWWRLTTTLAADSAQQVCIRPYVFGRVTLDASVSPSRPTPGQPTAISGSLRYQGAPITGADVHAQLRDPAGTLTMVSLHDDGVSPDSSAADGVYAAVLPAVNTSGRCLTTLEASGGGVPTYAPRTRSLSYQVGASPNIVLAASDLSLGSTWAYIGDPLPIGVSVHNLATVPADSVWLVGRDDSTGVAFLDTVVAVPAQSAAMITSRFASPLVGVHALRFMAFALGDVPDVSTTNQAARVVEVVPFGGTSSLAVPPPLVPPVHAYLPTRAVPNPTVRSSMLEFYLPASAARVELTILDAAGRLVWRAQYGAFPAGWNRIAWDASPARSAGVSPGVYFYRIEAGERRGQGRLVILR